MATKLVSLMFNMADKHLLSVLSLIHVAKDEKYVMCHYFHTICD